MRHLKAPYPFNTIRPRFVAGIVDGLVFWPLSFVTTALQHSEPSAWTGALWPEVYFMTFWLHSVLMHWRYGGTLGKLFCDIRVIDHYSGARLTLWQAFVRDSVYVAITVLLFAFGTLVELLDLSPEGRWPPRPAPPLYVALKWTFGSIFWSWLLAEVTVALLNKQRRAVHDLIARTVVIRVA
ncbi:MAG: RDD family protein [bacterium]|nr:RDD family protein [bacterium]